MLVACKQCSTAFEGSNRDYCQVCRPQGHLYRLMTADELRASLTMPHIAKYPITVQRRSAAIQAIENYREG